MSQDDLTKSNNTGVVNSNSALNSGPISARKSKQNINVNGEMQNGVVYINDEQSYREENTVIQQFSSAMSPNEQVKINTQSSSSPNINVDDSGTLQPEVTLPLL